MAPAIDKEGRIDNSKVDYEPRPENSIPVSSQRDRIIERICSLYSGSASVEDMGVYAERAVYDDPLSFCEYRFSIFNFFGQLSFFC